MEGVHTCGTHLSPNTAKLYFSFGNIFIKLEIPSLGTIMQELICNIEFDQEDDQFVAKLRTEMGGLREYTSVTFEEVLNMVMIELQEEFA